VRSGQVCQEDSEMWKAEKKVLQGSQEVQEQKTPLPQRDLHSPAHVFRAVVITQHTLNSPGVVWNFGQVVLCFDSCKCMFLNGDGCFEWTKFVMCSCLLLVRFVRSPFGLALDAPGNPCV
jgi:hypothetical protein